jgi:5-(carboxyamino)imidazole ribonucleotide synthase
MVNLLGLPSGQAASLEQRLALLRSEPDLHVHWYDKQGESAGRKLGHVTVVLDAEEAGARRYQAKEALERVRAIWPLPIN